MRGYKCPDCGANLDPGEKCDCKKCESTKIEIKNVVPFRISKQRGFENVKRTV